MINKIVLNKELTNKLDKSPESGMSYHTVDVELKSGKVLEDRVVFNSSYLVLKPDDDIQKDDIEDIKTK